MLHDNIEAQINGHKEPIRTPFLLTERKTAKSVQSDPISKQVDR